LRSGISESTLLERIGALSTGLAPVGLGALQVSMIGRFIALVPTGDDTAIAALASRCVDFAEPMRAPLSSAERERRLTGNLSSRQVALLDRFGYPYVHDEFRFHMTLTGPLAACDQTDALTGLRALYELIDHPVAVDAITLLRQDNATANFTVLRRYPLTG
jgi:hypothetical protein